MFLIAAYYIVFESLTHLLMYCSPAALVPAAARDLPSISTGVHFVDVLQLLSLDRLGPKLLKVN